MNECAKAKDFKLVLFIAYDVYDFCGKVVKKFLSGFTIFKKFWKGKFKIRMQFKIKHKFKILGRFEDSYLN